MIYDADGREVEATDDGPCPRCNRPAKDRVKHTSFGGFWKLACACGYEFDKGREE